MNPEDLAKLHPRVSERMARDSDEIRNRLEEARRMNVEEMRDLHRFGSGYMCVQWNLPNKDTSFGARKVP